MLTGSVGVTVTATDGDGDHVTSGAVDISNQITFLDDGPTVNPTVHADATVSLDETGPAVASTISTGAIVKGDDPDVSGSGAISKATSGVAIVDAHAAFGADGPAASNSLSYALSITNASSGLTTTDGHAINLVAQGGVIVGVVSGGTFDGQAAFAISIDPNTGVVTVEQYLSLNQPITTDPNDAVHMLTGSIGVTVTATDGDGDHVTSGAVDISNQIIFHDDGPTAHADVNSVSEGGHVSGNVETNDLFGADGKASGGGVTGVEAGSHPTDIVTTGVGQTIAGTFGSLVLNADGTYTYTATPNTNPPPGSTDVFTYTITDGDGDKSTTTLTITVNDVTLNPDDQTKVVNEAALDLNKDGADLAAGTVTGSNPSSTAETVQGTLAVVGATGYTAEDLTGTHGVFHLNANGTYTYTLTSPVDGTTADNGTNTVNGVETFTYTAHDADGNTVTGTVTINVIDDVPTAHADTDSVTEDGPLVADGNVLTGTGGSDLNSTDGVADTQGADGATVTGVKLPASGSFTSVPTGATGTTIIGSHGTLVLHADGSYTYTLNNADTSVQALGQGQSTTDTFNYQITDGDGDTSTTTLTITINGTNDAPVVGSSTATVSEEGLTGANPDNVGSPTDTTNSVTATGTVSFTDVDSGDTHTVTLTAPANGSLTSNGFNVIWTGSGTNTLHAFQDVNGNGLVDAGEKAIMTITINNSGAYTVTLQGPIDHPTANVEDVDGFGVTVNVSDGHTTSTGTLNVNVEDDSPVSFTPDPQPSLVDDGTASATGLINDPASNSTGVNFIGADGFGSLFFTGTSALDGTALTDASSNPLTSHGQPILLSGFGTDTLTAYVDSGAHAGFQSGEDTVVFTVTLNDGTTYGSDATYTINFSDTIDNGSGVSFNNLTSTNAGNVDYRGVGADSATTPIDLLLSGTATGGAIGTVNTDSTAIGVSNQSMDAGESLRIDFVSDLASGGAGPTGFNFSGHVSSNGFIGFIPQVQGAQSNTVSFTVYALDTTVTQTGAPDSNPTGGFSDGSVLTTTQVYAQDYLTGNTATLDISGLAVGSTTAVGSFGVTVTKNADGSVTFHGIQEGDHYGVTTATDFNAIVVQDNSGSFDLGVFSLSQTNQGSNIDMNFGVTAQDADGDTSTGTIAVTLTPEAQQAAPIHTAMTTMAPLSTASTDTSSLTASNDNTDHGQQRTFNVANNTALMGAIAAAGLDSLHGLQLDHASVSGLDHSSSSLQPTHDMVVSSAPVEAPHVDTSPDMQVLATATTHAAPQSGGAAHDMVVSSQPLTPANAQPAAPTDLPHGSEGPAHAAAAASAVVAMAVTMPSAAQLAAAASHGVSQAPDSVGGATPQHEQVVSKVLVDALHGGGGGSVNIDGLLNNAGIHGASQDALQALASHGSAAVSFGHTAFADAFGGAHGMLLMHPDVAPPVHG
jgi:VCBS repeat-containing protein